MTALLIVTASLLPVALVAGYFMGGRDEAESQARERAMVIAACLECERGNGWVCPAKGVMMGSEERRA